MIKRLCDICGGELVVTPVRTRHDGHVYMLISKRLEGGRRGVRGYEPDMCAQCYEQATGRLHRDAVALVRKLQEADNGKA